MRDNYDMRNIRIAIRECIRIKNIRIYSANTHWRSLYRYTYILHSYFQLKNWSESRDSVSCYLIERLLVYFPIFLLPLNIDSVWLSPFWILLRDSRVEVHVINNLWLSNLDSIERPKQTAIEKYKPLLKI